MSLWFPKLLALSQRKQLTRIRFGDYILYTVIFGTRNDHVITKSKGLSVALWDVDITGFITRDRREGERCATVHGQGVIIPPRDVSSLLVPTLIKLHCGWKTVSILK